MNKANSLKAHLVAAVPTLRHDPERLLVFIDQGRTRSTVAEGLSFEYGYTLNVIITDFAGHPDAVMVPLLAWMKVNQPDLMANLDKAKDAIQFEADILANDLVDLSITLPLTERVIVKKQEDGSHTVEHIGEPQLEESFTVPGLRIETPDGEVLAEWGNP